MERNSPLKGCFRNFLGLWAAMGKAEEYERHAAECLRLARVVRDADTRAILIEMARVWQKLADRERAKVEGEKV